MTQPISKHRSRRQDLHAAARATTEVLHDINLDDRPGRVRLDHRPLRLRQVDAAQPRRRPDAGRRTGAVLLEDQEVNEPGPDRAVVFQNHSLLPWLTVYDNVAPRRRQGVRARQDARRAPRLDDAQSRARADGARQGQAPVGDLRRHEAARRHRPRARHGAQGAAAGRAVRRARRADPRAPAGHGDGRSTRSSATPC